MAIPKIIHYCWFGGNPLPESARKCVESWKKFCPDYEIVEWNEKNFDINCNAYVKEAYEAKKWAFVTDFVRLYVLVHHGGIYMDTDVEVIKPLDELLRYDALSGFESKTQIQTGLMACREGHEMFKIFLREYDDIHFLQEDGSPDLTTNVIRITKICERYGLQLNNTEQTINGFTLLPNDYFCPKNFGTGEIVLTENTYAIHHFDSSWYTEEQHYAQRLKQKYGKFLPRKVAPYVAMAQGAVVYRGISGVAKDFVAWMKRRRMRRKQLI